MSEPSKEHVITITTPITVVVYEAEEGGYWGEVPNLPGCFSQAETMEEMLANLKEAAECWLAPIPPDVARRIAAKRAKRAKSAAAEQALQVVTRKPRSPKRTG